MSLTYYYVAVSFTLGWLSLVANREVRLGLCENGKGVVHVQTGLLQETTVTTLEP